VEMCDDNLDAAGALLEEVAAVQRELRDEAGLARALDNLGIVAIHQRDAHAARTNFTEALTLALRCGCQLDVADALLGFALTATLTDELERASMLHGAADQLLQDLGGIAFERELREPRAADLAR